MKSMWVGCKASVLCPVKFTMSSGPARIEIGDIVEIKSHNARSGTFSVKVSKNGKSVIVSDIPQHYLKVSKENLNV